MSSFLRKSLLVLIIVLFNGIVFADGGRWKYSSGIDYSTGDYNDSTETEIYYVPVSISYKRYRLTGKVTTGWLSIDGPGNVTDGGVVPSGDESRTESGVADTWLSLGYDIFFIPDALGYFDVTAKVKFPTADEDKGLGTGEMDYTAQLDYFYSIKRLTPMLTAAYKFKGDPEGEPDPTVKPKKNPKGQDFPDEIDFNDVWYLSAGADLRLLKHLHFGASFDYQQASVDGIDDSRELFTYVSYKVTNEWGLMPYFYYGLSSSSPDFGGGLQFSYKP